MRWKTFGFGIAALWFLSSGILPAQTTPLNEPIPDAQVVLITCALTQAPKAHDTVVLSTQKDADKAVGTYHYRLWVPPGYNATPGKKWPCIFIMNAGGGASMGAMEPALQANGFIAIMLQEARNGDWPPIVGNFLAAHDDAMQRLRIAPSQKYATGYSGGARGSTLFAQLRPGFCGLILQGAGAVFGANGAYEVAGLKRNPALHIAMTMGNTDNNKVEVDKMKMIFGGQRLAAFPFDGGHVWAPANVFTDAMTWLVAKNAANPPAEAGSAGGSPGNSSFDDFFKKK